jgi:UDP-N-acetylmuramate dehydrogenase
MNKVKIKKFLALSKIEFKIDVLLSDLTKINSEAKCDFFCKPDSLGELKQILTFCTTHKITFDIIGNLTNVYFSNCYHTDLLISTLGVKEVVYKDGTIICSCGVNLSKFSRDCITKGIAGYEGFVGIPGTIGAAAINNSGAFQSTMSNVVKSILIFTPKNEINKLTNEELKYYTRSSAIKRGEILGYVLSVELKSSKKAKIEDLLKKVEENKKYRKKNIDGFRKSLGSVFVSTSLQSLMTKYRFQLLLKKITYAPFKLIIKDSKKRDIINTYLVFLFLGIPKYAKHCDSLNRFCWDEKTTELDFMSYIKAMQRLANNKLTLEINIKETK